MQSPWYLVENIEEISSPALLIYPTRVEENIHRVIEMVDGDVARLRPHAKTHKLVPLTRLQLKHGIRKFKCATVAEAEMLAKAGAAEVLLAYQPVGPNIRRLVDLIRAYPQTRFASVVDNRESVSALSDACTGAKITLDVFLDLDSGMGRTGVPPGDESALLYQQITQSPGLRPAGLHAYDGHIHDADPRERASRCEAAFAPVLGLQSKLLGEGLAAPLLDVGGTPTFPFHARRKEGVECSPGTCLLWDFGYSTKLKDMSFQHAALVLTRVISKPRPTRLCLDLGHKAIASENPHPRVHLIDLPDATFISHSEEHLVVESPNATRFQIGQVLYGIPWHVCPTVALYSEAAAVLNGRVIEQWPIDARARRISI